MNDIEIKPADKNDRDAIELLTRLWVKEVKGEKFDQKRFDWGILRRLYDEVQRQGIFLAVSLGDKDLGDKKIVGMVICELKVNPHGRSEGYITQLFVRSEYRGEKIGNNILETCISNLKKLNVQSLKVKVKKGAEDSFKIYSKRDFKFSYSVLSLNLD